MIEKIANTRVFLYKREKLSAASTDCNWTLVRRFNKFPEELESESGFLRVMSPCFEYYIDIQKDENIFVIKDTLIQNVVYKIEKYLMDPSKENAKDIMNRFKWIDSKTIRIINSEGIEKMIDLANN